MNDVVEQTQDEAEAKPRRGRRVKPGPNAELRKRRAARMERGSVDHGFNQRLGLDEDKLDHNNYRWRWVRDDPGRIANLKSREWEQVEEDDVGGQEVARAAGYGPEGKPSNCVLMRKWKEWFNEDAERRQKAHKTLMADMMRGKAEAQRSEDGEAPGYADENNRVEDAVMTPKRNPDFE